MSLLTRLTNLHFTAFFFVIGLAAVMRSQGMVGAGEWADVTKTAISVFIGFGGLKEIVQAWTSQGAKNVTQG